MKVLIIGAGLAGLGAGIQLKKNSVDFNLFESTNKPGGLAKSDNLDGFLFDYSGHYLHIQTEEGYNDLIHESIAYDQIKRKSAVNIDGITLPYPIQYNLRFFDRKDILKIHKDISQIKECEFTEISTLADFFKKAFGNHLYQMFFKPYNEKLWGTSLKNLPYDCLGSYFPKINTELMFKGSIEPTSFEGYNQYFYYPKTGKISSLPEYLSATIKNNISYAKGINKIDINAKIIRDSDGIEWEYDYLLSSIPLNKMAKMLQVNCLENAFGYSNIVCLRIAFKGSLLHPNHWVYVPEKKYPFYRIGFPKNVNQVTSPDGYCSLTVEINKNHFSKQKDKMTKMVIDYLKENKLIAIDQVLFSDEILLAPAYTYASFSYRKKIKDFNEYLIDNNIYNIGRYGIWKYYSMEEAYLSGKKIAKNIQSKLEPLKLKV